MRSVALLLLITLSVADGAPQRHGVFFWTLKREDVESLARHVPQLDGMRLAQLRQTFLDMQCSGDNLRQEGFDHGKNLICTLPGSSADTILFVAHYEHNGPGKSAIENWSGATMLPFLYHALMAAPRKHTFVFAELDGEAGARAYLQSLSHIQRHNLKALVAVDALGLGSPSFYLRPNGNTLAPVEADLETTLQLAAREKGIEAPAAEIPGSWFKVDDTKQFRYSNIPSILIHSVDRGSREVPGTEKDTLDAFNGDAYFSTYTLLCYYIVELDAMKTGDDERASSSLSPSRGRR
jgi:hypothetical protein